MQVFMLCGVNLSATSWRLGCGPLAQRSVVQMPWELQDPGSPRVETVVVQDVAPSGGFFPASAAQFANESEAGLGLRSELEGTPTQPWSCPNIL